MEFRCSKERDFWKSKRLLTNLKSPGSLENLLFQGREGFVELPNFPFSEECVTDGGWYGRGGGATYLFLGGYVCRMTQNCDP